MNVPDAPGANELTVSVYFVALTVTTAPEPESLGVPELVVNVPQLDGAAKPSSVMIRLLAVNFTQFASPFDVVTLV